MNNQIQSLLNNKLRLGVLSILIVFIGSVGYVAYNAIINRTRLVPHKEAQAQTSNEVEMVRRVLVFTLDTSNPSSHIKLKNLAQYNGIPQDPDADNTKQYSLTVIENGQPAYLTYFDLPQINYEKIESDGTITSELSSSIDEYQLLTPSFSLMSTYIIRNASGKVLLEGSLLDTKIENHENVPEYKTLVDN